MPVVTLINRNILRPIVSTRCCSWYSKSFQNSSALSLKCEHSLSMRKSVPAVTAVNSTLGFQCRFKYGKSVNKKGKDEDDDSMLTKEFWAIDDSNDTKLTTIRVTSLRMDSIVKSGLGLARNKIEAAFFDSRIRVNGKKVAKKSVTLHIGDEVDVIKGVSPINNEHLLVSRIEIVDAKGNEEDISVALRRYKSLTIENYSGQNAYKQVNPSS